MSNEKHEHDKIVVSKEEYDRLVDAIENSPPRVLPRLAALLREASPWRDAE